MIFFSLYTTSLSNRDLKTRVLNTRDASFQHYFETWQLTKFFNIYCYLEKKIPKKKNETYRETKGNKKKKKKRWSGGAKQASLESPAKRWLGSSTMTVSGTRWWRSALVSQISESVKQHGRSEGNGVSAAGCATATFCWWDWRLWWWAFNSLLSLLLIWWSEIVNLNFFFFFFK